MDKIKSAARLCYKLLMFKGLLPAAYRLYSAAPVIEKKAVFIEVRLPRMSNNFTLLHDRLTERGWDTSLCCLRLGSCGAAAYIKNCLAMIKEIARAQVIFINDGSTVVSSLPIRRETTMIQTWHACGAFKKFGMSNVGSLVRGSRRERELFPMCRHMDYISVSSDEVKWAYREAFDVRDGDGQTIVAAGVSRTDVFFQPRSIEKARAAIGERFPKIGGRRIILYAPTFRGDATDAKAPDALDVPLMCERLGSEYVLLIKQHPLTGGCGEIPPECRDFAFDAGDA
ncbi:MAG: CDP-glycerol glycerophosphotransferase family protein, partial [Clostridia bacterium]|nr:CDP-glycerol glycerophosphotransferase family protein [Clostridia bacterium]